MLLYEERQIVCIVLQLIVLQSVYSNLWEQPRIAGKTKDVVPIFILVVFVIR